MAPLCTNGSQLGQDNQRVPVRYGGGAETTAREGQSHPNQIVARKSSKSMMLTNQSSRTNQHSVKGRSAQQQASERSTPGRTLTETTSEVFSPSGGVPYQRGVPCEWPRNAAIRHLSPWIHIPPACVVQPYCIPIEIPSVVDFLQVVVV